jgi:hypothetical protein
VCVILCTVFRLIVVLFCAMCVVCVLCLIVVPLPPGENPFAVKINNNNNFLEGTEENYEVLNQNIWCPGRDSKQTLPNISHINAFSMSYLLGERCHRLCEVLKTFITSMSQHARRPNTSVTYLILVVSKVDGIKTVLEVKQIFPNLFTFKLQHELINSLLLLYPNT